MSTRISEFGRSCAGRLAFYVPFALLLSSCDTTTTPNYLRPTTYLLKNFTFDSAGVPGLHGWTYSSMGSDSLAVFKKDVPRTSDATWSLMLTPGWVPSRKMVTRDFSKLSSGVYQLSVTAKLKEEANFSPQIALLVREGNGFQAHRSKAIATGGDWQVTTLTDTMRLSLDDTLRISLDGGACEVCDGEILYNSVTLAKLP
jgi:hypothetical protein